MGTKTFLPRIFRRAVVVCLAGACGVAGVFYAPVSTANIYSFRDENGITHFTNMPHLDRRYKLVYRIPTAGQYRPFLEWRASRGKG